MTEERKEIHLYEKTVEEVYQALEKNGFDFIRGTWFFWDKGMVTGGCVLGQTALNLHAISGAEGGETEELFWANDPKRISKAYDEGKLTVWAKNEDTLNSGLAQSMPLTLFAQLNRFRVINSKWFVPGVERAGDAIIHWNDRKAAGGYYLKSYEAVARMAKDILEPYFKEKVYLIQFVLPTKPLVIA